MDIQFWPKLDITKCWFDLEKSNEIFLPFQQSIYASLVEVHWYRSLAWFTHISMSSFLWDIGKQRRPRSESLFFAYIIFFQNLNEKENYHQTTLKTEMDRPNC